MWKPGQSGNPVGKKPGTGKIDKLRAALTKELPEVLAVLVTQAKTGDTGAIKLVLERTVPALRPVGAATPLNLPAAGGLADQGRAVMVALAARPLPVNQAAGILQSLVNLAKRVELDEEKWVAALEGKRG